MVKEEVEEEEVELEEEEEEEEEELEEEGEMREGIKLNCSNSSGVDSYTRFNCSSNPLRTLSVQYTNTLDKSEVIAR